MSDSLESQQFRRWLRRPTLFVANAWYLLAAAGLTITGYLAQLAVLLLNSLPRVTAVEGAVGASASVAYEVLVLALPVLVYAIRHEGVGQSMRLNPPRFDMMLYAVVTAFIGVTLVNCLSAWWMLLIEALGGRLVGSGIPIPTTMEELYQNILLVGVVPGVCEEIFFRGGLMGAWERRGTWFGLVVTTVLFALLHGSVLGLPTQLLMGAVLGYVLLLSDSLYVSMIYHTTHNVTALAIAYFSRQAADSDVAAETMAQSVAAASGYGALLTQTLVTAVMFAGCLLVMTLARKRSGAEIEKIQVDVKSRMAWQELLVLIAGLLTVAANYITELLQICGAI